MSLGSYVKGQTKTTEPISNLTSYKSDEFGKISNKNLRARLQRFFVEVIRTKGSAGDIVVYAPTKKLQGLRVDKIHNLDWLSIADFDYSRITYIAVKSKRRKTEFWIIPKGAEPSVFRK